MIAELFFKCVCMLLCTNLWTFITNVGVFEILIFSIISQIAENFLDEHHQIIFYVAVKTDTISV